MWKTCLDNGCASRMHHSEVNDLCRKTQIFQITFILYLIVDKFRCGSQYGFLKTHRIQNRKILVQSLYIAAYAFVIHFVLFSYFFFPYDFKKLVQTMSNDWVKPFQSHNFYTDYQKIVESENSKAHFYQKLWKNWFYRDL